ncbi:AraC family transcriptional regulator, partial [Burkholderia cenocepacia]
RSRELALHAAPTGNPLPPRVLTPGAPELVPQPG